MSGLWLTVALFGPPGLYVAARVWEDVRAARENVDRMLDAALGRHPASRVPVEDRPDWPPAC